MSLDHNIGENEKLRIKDFITQGIRMKQEVKDINDALKDLSTAIGEEINVKPNILMKALGIAFKGQEKAQEEQESFTTVEEILALVGII